MALTAIVKQSTAVTVTIGPFLDETDGQTAETALTISQADVRLSKNDGAFAQKNDATAATHKEAGYYSCPLNTTDTATLGTLSLAVDEAGALPIRHDFSVVAANVWDTFFSTEHFDVNVVEISDDTTAANNEEAFFDGTGYAGTNNVIPTVTTAGLSGAAINAVADQVWDEVMSGHTASGSYGQRLFPVRTATAQAGAAGTITLDASASATDDFYNNTLIAITAGTGVNQARFISDYVGATKVASVNGNWVTNPSSDSVFVITQFGAVPGASAPTAAENADAVWDELRSGHVVGGSFGEYVLADALRVSGDATAADNLEAAFDGTGYAGIGAVDAGTAQAAAATTITLRAGFTTADDNINGSTVFITSATTGAFQSRVITDWNNTTKVATVDQWTTTPTGTITYLVMATAPSSTVSPPNVNVVQISGDATAADNAEAFFDGSGYSGSANLIGTVTNVTNATVTTASRDAIADQVWDEAQSGHVASGSFGQAAQAVRAGTAQAGGASTITLDAGASATDDFYNNGLIFITSSVGAGQARFITDYVGATKVATVNRTWTTNPTSSSIFVIVPFDSIPGASAPTAADVADAVWDEARAGHVGGGSFGEGVASVQGNVTGSVGSVTALVTANMTQLSGDAAAADNAEAFFDGTGYAGTNNVIPTVTAVTNLVSANVTQISGDGTAADNLEASLDGTGGVTLSVVLGANAITATSLAADALTAAKVAADVGTEIAAAVAGAALSELAQAQPSATPTLAQAVMLLYMALRNDSAATATERRIRNDAGTVITKATMADSAGTFTQGKLVSGP